MLVEQKHSNRFHIMSSSVPYSLFVYKWELKINRTRAKNMQLQKAKLNLTKDLVSKTLGNIGEYSNKEGDCLRRSIQYKFKLENVVDERSSLVFAPNRKKMENAKEVEEAINNLKEAIKNLKLSQNVSY